MPQMLSHADSVNVFITIGYVFGIIFTAILNSNNVMWSMAVASANHFIVYGTKA